MAAITRVNREASRAASLLSDAFNTNPTVTYLLANLTPAQREDYRPRFFQAIMKAAVFSRASIDEVGGWQACGVLMAPGTDVESWASALRGGFADVLWTVGVGGSYRMVRELPSKTHACKAQVLERNAKYYYVYFLGTAQASRGKGLCSALLKQYQAEAQQAGLPIWLEAGDEYCRDIYARLGFETVGEIVCGRGKHAADGTLREGGPGVTIWGMIWRPDDHSKE